MLNLLIKVGKWAETKRDTAIVEYVKTCPKATAGDIARKFGITHHQAVTGILRENGIKRAVQTANPPALSGTDTASGSVEVPNA